MRLLGFACLLFLAGCAAQRHAVPCGMRVVDDGTRHEIDVQVSSCESGGGDRWNLEGLLQWLEHDEGMVGLVGRTTAGRELFTTGLDGTFAARDLSGRDTLVLEYPGFTPRTIAVGDLLESCGRGTGQ